MDDAAMAGHLSVIKFLREHDIDQCSSRAMDGAAEGGHLKVVRFLHENRTEGCTVALR